MRSVDILESLKARKVKHLVHFTVLDNLPSICKNGICSRFDQEQNGSVGVWTDANRYDAHLDCSSFSITFPNYLMMYHKSKHFDLAVLLIDPMALEELGEENIAFYQGNAANKYNSSSSFSAHCGVKALDKMFEAQVTDSKGIIIQRAKQCLPITQPTDPQAEVMIRGVVNPKYIKKIIFKTDADRESFNNIQARMDVDPRWFGKPHKVWSEYMAHKGVYSYGYSSGVYCA